MLVLFDWYISQITNYAGESGIGNGSLWSFIHLANHDFYVVPVH